jgi:signal transduction histidine kinase
MTDWFSSLQFRTVLAFAGVLALALGGVSLYVGHAAQRGVDQFESRRQEVRVERVQGLLARHYSQRESWAGLQTTLDRSGPLIDRRILVTDAGGKIVGDSQWERDGRWHRGERRGRRHPINVGNDEVGSVLIAPSAPSRFPREPAVSRLAAAVDRSLLWTGLAAGAGGLLLVSLTSRWLLSPIRSLSAAARRLGQGDFSQRVSLSGPSEMGQLARTFNAMAENLERLEAQRRNLVADVAHEIRTPLSNIQGYLEAIKDGLLQPTPATIDTIHNQVLHLNLLVEDLRLLALAEAGALQLDLREDSLAVVLEEAVLAFRPRAELKGVELALDVPPGLPPVHLDRTRIAQVAGNLLDNAVRHTPTGSAVTVIAAVSGEMAAVTVADAGPGIPESDLPFVFERFYRVDPSRSRSTGGTGLGLTIARQLVEAHGGHIQVDSTPGQGTRFTFNLPLAPDSTEV